MKTCGNCRQVYADDYAGQCQTCGRPMGDTSPNGDGDLAFRYASQISRGQREAGYENAMKRGNYEGVPIDDRILDAARRFVIGPKE